MGTGDLASGDLPPIFGQDIFVEEGSIEMEEESEWSLDIPN